MTSLEAAARTAFGHLAAVDPLPDKAADAVIGFGTFDLTLAVFCGDLFMQRRAPLIVFTGGIGAGTADLGEPEADAWSKAARAVHPSLPREKVLLENRSTNTAENITFTAEMLSREYGDLAFGVGIKRALIVASPSRLRRVKLTMQHLQPTVTVRRALPHVSFERERALHESKGIDYLAHLCGELDRIVEYPKRGWIVEEPLPKEIAAAHAVLRSR